MWREGTRALAAEAGALGSSFAPLICFGSGCAEPHHTTGRAALQPGDAVILDVGLDFNHAMSDMTRTVFFGSATDEQKRVYEVVRAANAAGKAAVRPGVRLSDIDRAARAVIEAAGYGPISCTAPATGWALRFTSRRMSARRAPMWRNRAWSSPSSRASTWRADSACRIEDLVLVTQDGCECLNRLDRDFMIV